MIYGCALNVILTGFQPFLKADPFSPGVNEDMTSPRGS